MEHIRQSIFAFLKNKNLKVLAITGDWGVGKTYFWKNDIFKNIPEEDKKEYYSYVSLFNIETINDLKIKLYYESEPMVKKDSNIAKLSYIDTINKSIEVIQKLQKVKIDNYLICFDDIERKSDKLDLKTFLGYVSELKELDNSNNKIVIIFNNNEIEGENKDILNKYKEKVFDMEVLYNPLPDFIIKIALDRHKTENTKKINDNQWFSIIEKELKTHKLKSLRLIKFILNDIEYFKKIINQADLSLHDISIANLVNIITFFNISKYQTPNDIKEMGIQILKILFTEKSAYSLSDDDFSKRRQTITPYIKKYRVNEIYDYHKEILNYVYEGYLINADIFIDLFNKFDKANKRQSFHKKNTDLEQSIFSNFSITQEEYISKIKEATFPNISELYADDLKRVLEPLQKINQSNIIKELLTLFKEKSNQKQISNREHKALIDIVKDTDNIKIINSIEIKKEQIEKLDISYFINLTLNHRVPNETEILSLKLLGVNDIEFFLKVVKDEDFFNKMIMFIYKISHFNKEFDIEILDKFKAALKNISQRSDLDKLRVLMIAPNLFNEE